MLNFGHFRGQGPQTFILGRAYSAPPRFHPTPNSETSGFAPQRVILEWNHSYPHLCSKTVFRRKRIWLRKENRYSELQTNTFTPATYHV